MPILRSEHPRIVGAARDDGHLRHVALGARPWQTKCPIGHGVDGAARRDVHVDGTAPLANLHRDGHGAARGHVGHREGALGVRERELHGPGRLDEGLARAGVRSGSDARDRADASRYGDEDTVERRGAGRIEHSSCQRRRRRLAVPVHRARPVVVAWDVARGVGAAAPVARRTRVAAALHEEEREDGHRQRRHAFPRPSVAARAARAPIARAPSATLPCSRM